MAVIVNAGSGTGDGEATRTEVQRLFAAQGQEVQVTLTHGGDEIRAAAQAALDARACCIVAGGGDGTINAVAQHLVDRDIVLGVLPLGTLNHFAKDLAIPLELEQAVRTVLDGEVMLVDVGDVNGHVFLNNSSLGLYPRLVQMRQRHGVRGIAKWFVAAWAAAKVLREHHGITVRVEVNGRQVVRRTPLVFIGNNEYQMAGLDAGSRASLVDGRLALYIVKGEGRMRLLRLFLQVLAGTATRGGELDMLRAMQVTIETPQLHLAVAVDGEVEALATPLEYRIRPGALRVLVPPPAAAPAT